VLLEFGSEQVASLEDAVRGALPDRDLTIHTDLTGLPRVAQLGPAWA
jgi:hypothetical protein